MNQAKKELILQWYAKADSDIMLARKAIDFPPIILDGACFHCQQAVEKYLKSYLIYQGKTIIKTHDLTLLLKSCSEFDYDFDNIDLKNLEVFAVDIRYPDNAFVPTLAEAQEYLQIAEEIKMIIREKIIL